ncbi:hypothetical protein PsW64_02076 [Pseudovibrio sp. W64]|nr:hypothetical protein PsW64_02076 [Pseudovibrio sp. W64]
MVSAQNNNTAKTKDPIEPLKARHQPTVPLLPQNERNGIEARINIKPYAQSQLSWRPLIQTQKIMTHTKIDTKAAKLLG